MVIVVVAVVIVLVVCRFHFYVLVVFFVNNFNLICNLHSVPSPGIAYLNLKSCVCFFFWVATFLG